MDNLRPPRANSPSAPASVSRATQERVGQSAPVESPRVHHTPPVHHSSLVGADKPGFSKKLVGLIGGGIVLLIIIVVAVCWMLIGRSGDNTAAAIDASKYQAVFFTNGQVYFGKLHAFSNDYMKLTDVFYLQTKETDKASENPQQTAKNTSNNVQLVKLGNEIHGPADEMVISKDQLLFFENLKSDGKVTGSISQYKKTNK